MKQRVKSNIYSAFDAALNVLTFKARTTKEIKTKLKEKGYSANQIEETVTKLTYYNYLDDEAYALSYIKANACTKGKKLILGELLNKGIDKSIILDCYEKLETDEKDTIQSIFDKRFINYDMTDEKQKRKVFSYFARRGFNYDSISSVINCHQNS